MADRMLTNAEILTQPAVGCPHMGISRAARGVYGAAGWIEQEYSVACNACEISASSNHSIQHAIAMLRAGRIVPLEDFSG